MLEVTKLADDRVDIAISGKLDADAMAEGLDQLITASAEVNHGKILYTISDIGMPSFSAIAVEFKRLPALMGLLGKFDKVAVLSDIGWIKKAAEIEGAVIPGLAINTYDLEETDAAEVWLEGPA